MSRSSGTRTAVSVTRRSDALADRLESGARALARFAGALTPGEWATPVPVDGRAVGVVVHHVASMYPLEIKLAQQLAAGEPITGVTWNDVHAINAEHARTWAAVSKDEAIRLLEVNSRAAAAAIREMTDAQLDAAGGISLYMDAPLTCQFMLEDHAVRHAWYHLARVRAAVLPGSQARAA